MNKILRNSKGIVGTDIVIALSIMILLAITIAAIYVNTNKNAISIQKSAQVNEMITNILEKIDLKYYDDISVTEGFVNISESNSLEYKELKDIIPQNKEGNKLYTVRLKVEEFVPEGASNERTDILKKITVNVKYELNKKEEEITMERLKYREIIITPNEPKLLSNLTPIKKDSNNRWIKANTKDNDWYNYENGNFAYAVITEDVEFDTLGYMSFIDAETELEIQAKEQNSISLWIPAFGKNSSNEYRYIYGIVKNGAKNKYADKIKENNFTYYKLNSEEIESNGFYENNKEVYGKWLSIYQFTHNYVPGTDSKTYEEITALCK